MLALRLLPQHALLALGLFALPALLLLLTGELLLLAHLLALQGLLVAVKPLFGLGRHALGGRRRGEAHDGWRLNGRRHGGRRDGQNRRDRCDGGNRHGRLDPPGQALAVFGSSCAGVARVVVGAVGRVERVGERPPVIAALALGPHDGLRGGGGRRQGGGRQPGAFALIGALRALRHRAVVQQQLATVQVRSAQGVQLAPHQRATGKIVPAGGRHGGWLALITVAVARVHRDVVVHPAEVARTGPVARPERFARSQRKPAQGGVGRAA